MSYTDPYATHQHVLDFYARQSQGTILEFGTGLYSTPLLREIVKGTGRQLVSFEHDVEWLNKMRELYPEDEQHKYVEVKDWKSFFSSFQVSEDVGLVFIDQSPWEARIWSLEKVKHTVDYVLVHDVDYFPKQGLFGKVIDEFTFDFTDLSPNFKVYYPDKPYPYHTGPPTLVFSNTGKELSL